MPISHPDAPDLDRLCQQLRELRQADPDDREWPARQLAACGAAGVFRWFLDPAYGGYGWSAVEIARGYLQLSAACLTTTFVITQRTGACKRIATSDNDSLRTQLLPDLAAGNSFATVGISHLTTSRRHLGRPALLATPHGDQFVLDGISPWVTGGAHAQHLVLGAETADGQQILCCLPTDHPGVQPQTPFDLVALSGSGTGAVRLDNVPVDPEWLLAGPSENVLAAGSGEGAGTGGLQTSMLAIGLSRAAIEYLETQSSQRDSLASPHHALVDQCDELESQLLEAVAGQPICTNDELRTRANSLVLRATQAALVAAKGAGFVAGHPVGRWCREALFFLVWSCPQTVSDANLCELAGILD